MLRKLPPDLEHVLVLAPPERDLDHLVLGERAGPAHIWNNLHVSNHYQQFTPGIVSQMMINWSWLAQFIAYIFQIRFVTLLENTLYIKRDLDSLLCNAILHLKLKTFQFRRKRRPLQISVVFIDFIRYQTGQIFVFIIFGKACQDQSRTWWQTFRVVYVNQDILYTLILPSLAQRNLMEIFYTDILKSFLFYLFILSNLERQTSTFPYQLIHVMSCGTIIDWFLILTMPFLFVKAIKRMSCCSFLQII